METVNRYLSKADLAIITSNIAKIVRVEKDGQLIEQYIVPSSYKGAISSFGASLVMSGLIPTIQFYMAESEQRDSNYKYILDAIAKIIYTPSSDAQYLKEQVMKLVDNRAGRNALKKKIGDAAVALKIMLRTYQFEKEKGS